MTFSNITEAIHHRTLTYLRCRNDALRLKKTSKITRTVRLERAEIPKVHNPGQWIQAARPEGAEALSPGQRPGLSCSQTWRPVRAKALKLLTIYKAFALTGRIADCQYTQGDALG